MKRNLPKKIVMRLMSVAVLSLSLVACAWGQDHAANKKSLQEMQAASKTTVVLNNEKAGLPVTNLEGIKIASVNLGFGHAAVFDSLLSKYEGVTRIDGQKYIGNYNGLNDDIKLYNTVILQLGEQVTADASLVSTISELQKSKLVILAVFGEGRKLAQLDQVSAPVIWSQAQTPEAAAFTAQAVFGGVEVNNSLKSNFSQKYKAGQGFLIRKIRLKYSVPEEVGINANNLLEIDDIAREAIEKKATPGAVVMVVKDGVVIMNKAYGSHTYDNTIPTRIDDIFDLASVTKISATTMAVMDLVEKNKLGLDSTLKAYIARTRNTNKADIAVHEVMMHQAGFIPFIPFHNYLKPGDTSRDSSAAFPTKAADGMYMRKGFFDEVMWPQMLNSTITTRGKYVYSDLSMYYMKEIVEKVTQNPLDQYVLNSFYTPLGMQTAGFLPRNRFPKNRIVPTENDTYFRMTLLEGYVHDQGASMVGGVSGHAGLFANANDLAILYQMVLNKGSYGGRQYFKPETVDKFTARQSEASRRGLGFDRWDPDASKKYPSELASPLTYGHTGYTGTCVWVDPKYNLVYIFLSNRVHPQVTTRLYELNIRPRIQDVVYRAIEKGQ